jgi:hypothetical protein
LITWRLWAGDGVLKANRDDPIFFQWMLLHAVRIFTHGDNPFFAEQLNAPYGVNLMANTSVLGLAIPFAPVTVLAGPFIAYLAMTTLGLAGTAYAWYHMLSRHLVRRRAAAVVGGYFCGFAPGMVAQAIGHPNIVSQFLVPFIVLAVLRLRDTARWRRNGLTLAGLVIYQTFINEEILFLLFLVLAVYLLGYWVQRRRELRPVLAGAAKAVGLCVAIVLTTLAVPLWWQFFGSASYHGLPVGVQEFGTDLLAPVSFSRETFVGSFSSVHKLASSAAEENTFFGVPVLLVLIGLVVSLWRRCAGARALACTLVVFWALSLGPHIRINGHLTDVPGPWSVVGALPLFNSVVPARLGLALIPMVGVLLALGLDRFEWPAGSSGRLAAGPPGRPWARWHWALGVTVAAILPVAPTPLTVSPPHVPPTPEFFTSGHWREWVPKDGVILTAPTGWVQYLGAMQWQLDTNLDFRIVGGYYLAPRPDDPTRRADFGPAYPPTMRLLWYVGDTGAEVYLSDEHRALARRDLREYHVTTIVLPVSDEHVGRVKVAAQQLFGPPTWVDDVWVWDVRAFVAG